MKWFDVITKAVKSVFGQVKLTHIAKASFVVAIMVFVRKVLRSDATPAVLLENISEFYNKLSSNQVGAVSILPHSIHYQDKAKQMFKAFLPRDSHLLLEKELRRRKVDFEYAHRIHPSYYFAIGMLWAMVGFLFYKLVLSDEHSGDMHTHSQPEKQIGFSDVIGLEESKQALGEVIEFMRDPSRYHRIGARMRKGIILHGPSGTGKTTLAKATAGEAGVPFFSCNASEFCQIYVGMGPKRVKELFKKAKEAAPSIIYIDEIDAIGNRKSLGMFNDGAGSEKNSTINQLLSEMDGFASHEQVLVIGSTNRIEMIDSSLLRAGRFDLKIRVPLPNPSDRFDILKYHLSTKTHSIDDLFLRRITD